MPFVLAANGTYLRAKPHISSFPRLSTAEWLVKRESSDFGVSAALDPRLTSFAVEKRLAGMTSLSQRHSHLTLVSFGPCAGRYTPCVPALVKRQKSLLYSNRLPGVG